MASSVDGAHYSYYLSFVAGGVVFTTGLMTQLFIVAVNILEKLKGRKVSITDKIITCLGALRAVYLLVCLSIIFCQNVFERDPITLHILQFLHMNLGSANIWLSTFLVVVFCLKMSSFHCDSFLHMKIVIFRRCIHVIYVSALISVGYTSIDFWIRCIKMPYNSTTRFEHIMPEKGNLKQLKIAHICLVMLWNFVFILLHCFSSIALITSLCLHVKKMKKVAICLVAHYRALKFTVFSLVGCIVHINITLCKRGVFVKLFNRREEQHTTMVETITS
ncbi:PREDICTED: taste receptor type 2 member 3-like [Nanorana parkeri]|uniref:taste receptor type 2 member 3-like n=1 Tax=Nanorana parkeri TaxID=125878 RepID=UPI000854FE31|nr:PREDICTED: taste receptor type 2 member 3-like [Nanorana parkeri]